MHTLASCAIWIKIFEKSENTFRLSEVTGVFFPPHHVNGVNMLNGMCRLRQYILRVRVQLVRSLVKELVPTPGSGSACFQ